jgi:hypothetical protein
MGPIFGNPLPFGGVTLLSFPVRWAVAHIVFQGVFHIIVLLLGSRPSCAQGALLSLFVHISI